MFNCPFKFRVVKMKLLVNRQRCLRRNVVEKYTPVARLPLASGAHRSCLLVGRNGHAHLMTTRPGCKANCTKPPNNATTMMISHGSLEGKEHAPRSARSIDMSQICKPKNHAPAMRANKTATSMQTKK